MHIVWVDSRGIEPLTSPCHGGVFPIELRAHGGEGGSRTPDLPVRAACFPDYTTSPKAWLQVRDSNSHERINSAPSCH